MEINALDYVFPIVSIGVAQDDRPLSGIREVLGTAFALDAGLFMTAAHVAYSSPREGALALAFMESDRWFPMLLRNVEVFPRHDIAIVEATVLPTPLFRWRFDEMRILDRVLTVGYPFAMDTEHQRISLRAFRGEVVGVAPLSLSGNTTSVYELGFQCPRGLSGAPLLYAEDGYFEVVGVVVGNKTTGISVFRDRETLTEQRGGVPYQVEKVYERFDAMHLGAAVTSRETAGLEAARLGGTLEDFMKRRGLAPGSQEFHRSASALSPAVRRDEDPGARGGDGRG